MANCSLPTYNFILLTSYFVSDSAATQFCRELLNVKKSYMQIAQNQTFDVQLSILIIKSRGPFFSDILFIRSYVNSITRHPSVVWCSRSISAMVTPTVFQNDILKYQNVCFSSSLNPLDIKRYFISHIRFQSFTVSMSFIHCTALVNRIQCTSSQNIQKISQLQTICFHQMDPSMNLLRSQSLAILENSSVKIIFNHNSDRWEVIAVIVESGT
ncbi:Hypothetical_protein [Hexamita inflata]|uniref:Hypothetical_protein n=1 Tax=Hexamita inflata TaxID=28002 RepID=A0AA86UB71_9EUKA|nr:Hypothetical protein HINF_LOCUS23118 [Hexamita inflata]